MAFAKVILLVYCILHCMQWYKAELYTALSDMEELLKTENILLQTLRSFIIEQEHRLDILKSHASYYASEHQKAAKDASEYLSNPVNAYLLVKRLTSDWKNTEKLMKNDIYEEAMSNLTRYREDVKFPTEEDLTGAATALLRLQDTYKLDTASVARGVLNGVQYSTQLSSGDCFELGRQSYNNRDFYHTILWMQEALHQHEEERNSSATYKWEILEYLAFSTYMQGDIQTALYLTDQLLSIYPNHERAKGNREYYANELKNENHKRGDDESVIDMDDKKQDSKQKVAPKEDYNMERSRYEKLCRREIELPVGISSKLKCQYVNKGKAFLLIAPLKEEEAYLKPRILIYRQVMYPNEIKLIKEMAQPRLKRATVQNYKTGELETANYRISKSAWLKESEHPVIDRISRRVQDIASLTTDTAEELQVVNYGIGGHYEPHFDFARKEETNAFKSLGTGNRIATVLFYMSNVAQGGATVFTSLDVALWPEEGSAAFWHNLHSSGGGDFLTRHAACPVLQGSKWVSNKWLHEKGQEFLRPCDPADATTASV